MLDTELTKYLESTMKLTAATDSNHYNHKVFHKMKLNVTSLDLLAMHIIPSVTFAYLPEVYRYSTDFVTVLCHLFKKNLVLFCFVCFNAFIVK